MDTIYKHSKTVRQWKIDRSFKKSGGGATFIFGCLLIALSGSLRLQAQCTSLQLDCDQIGIEICANDGSVVGCNSCGTVEANCHQVKFEVWLTVTAPGLLNGNYCLDYEQLTINTKLVISNAEFGIPLSRLNGVLSKSCSNGFDWDCYYHLDESKGEVNLDIPGGNDGGCMGGLPDIIVPISGGSGSLYLFTVVVDAWPDEDVSLVCDGLILVSEESVALPDEGSDGLFSCSNTTSEDSDKTISCSNSDEISIASAGLDVSGDYSILLNEVDLSNHPDFHDCLVQLKANENIDADHFLDFTLLVTTTVDMIEPTIVEDNQDLDVDWEPPVAFINGSGQKVYLFYIRLAESGPVSSDIYDLFRVRIYPPVYISAGGDACIEFGKGRIRSGSTACDLLDSENDFENSNNDCTTFGDEPDACTNDLAVQVKGITPTSCDGTLQAEVTFDWTGTAPLGLDFFKFVIEFQGADVSVVTVTKGSAYSFTYNETTYACSGHNTDGLDWDGNRVSICYSKGDPSGLFSLYKNDPLTITLSVPNGCIDSITYREVELSLNGGTTDETCIPEYTNLTTDAIPLCIPEIGGTVEDELNATVDLVEVDIRNTSDPATCLKETESGCTGYATCVCGYDDYVITPSHNQNHLNGVSTYDMVLISKHILGIEYFTEHYQLMAANVNYLAGSNAQNSVTTFDIVAIRKVVLGIETIFDPATPNDASWRFYPASHTFTGSTQTITDPQPPSNITVTVSSMGNSPSNLDFKAVKIGDINSTHIANACRPASRSGEEQANAGGYPVGLPISAAARSGDYITLPLVNDGTDMMEGFQACFRFDPAAFEYVGASQGEVEGISQACFGLHELEQGIIRMAWLSPDMEAMLWKPGQTLCHFTFRVKRKALDMAVPLALEQSVLACQAYAGDRIYDLELSPAPSVSGRQPLSATAAPFNVQCRPNPAVGDAGLLIDMPEASEKIKIAVFSAFGQRLFFRQTDLPAGRSDIALPEAAQWAPGVYTWRVWNKSGRQEGKLIKQ